MKKFLVLLSSIFFFLFSSNILFGGSVLDSINLKDNVIVEKELGQQGNIGIAQFKYEEKLNPEKIQKVEKDTYFTNIYYVAYVGLDSEGRPVKPLALGLMINKWYISAIDGSKEIVRTILVDNDLDGNFNKGKTQRFIKGKNIEDMEISEETLKEINSKFPEFKEKFLKKVIDLEPYPV